MVAAGTPTDQAAHMGRPTATSLLATATTFEDEGTAIQGELVPVGLEMAPDGVAKTTIAAAVLDGTPLPAAGGSVRVLSQASRVAAPRDAVRVVLRVVTALLDRGPVSTVRIPP